MTARSAPAAVRGVAGPAVGARHSTRAPRPPGAASRFVGLQTPPSTYSRPPISTGANSHGTAQEASTASATLAVGAPGAPSSTRRPLRRSTTAMRSRPSKRAPSAASWRPRPSSRRCGRGAAASAAARASAAGGREAGERDRGQRRGGGGAEPRGGPAEPAQRALRRRRRGLAPLAGGAVAGLRPAAAGQGGGHDRPRRRPDQVLAVAEVEPGRRLDPAQEAAQPRLAERSAGAEDERVRKLGDWHAGDDGGLGERQHRLGREAEGPAWTVMARTASS